MSDNDTTLIERRFEPIAQWNDSDGVYYPSVKITTRNILGEWIFERHQVYLSFGQSNPDDVMPYAIWFAEMERDADNACIASLLNKG